MAIRLITSQADLDRYDQWIKRIGNGNLWQSLERKAYLEALGKEVRIYTSEDDGEIRASALVMIDRTIFGWSSWEIPRGPIWGLEDSSFGLGILKQMIDDAKKERCFALYYSPNTPLIPSYKSLATAPSRRLVHSEATRIIDLTLSEDEILSQMKQKGRYNIKVAQKNDIIVKESRDIDAFYDLVTKTGKRDSFVHLSKAQYQAFLNDLPGSFLLLAYPPPTPNYQPQPPIAGVLNVVWEERLIYYYGASNHEQRAKMAPYLLQWESMRYAKERGCTEYDLLGIAPEENGKRKTENGKFFFHFPLSIFHSSPHQWSGISSFKEKFGGEVVMYPKEQMIVLKPIVYWLLKMKRKFFG